LDERIKEWSRNRTLDSNYDNSTGLLSIVTSHPDSPFIHIWAIGSRPYPYIYSIYIQTAANPEQDEDKVITYIESDLIRLGVSDVETSPEETLSTLEFADYNWTLSYSNSSQSIQFRVSTVDISRPTLNMEFTGSISAVQSPALDSDLKLPAGPCSILYKFMCYDAFNQTENLAMSLFFQSSEGKLPRFTNFTSLQYGGGDFYLKWKDTFKSGAEQEFARKAKRVGNTLAAVPVSFGWNQQPQMQGELWFDLEGVSRRALNLDVVQVDAFTQTEKFKSWASQSNWDYSENNATGDHTVTHRFVGQDVSEHAQFTYNHQDNTVELLLQNDTFVSYYQSVSVESVTVESGTYDVAEYSVSRANEVHMDTLTHSGSQTQIAVISVRRELMPPSDLSDADDIVQVQHTFFTASKEINYYGKQLKPWAVYCEHVVTRQGGFNQGDVVTLTGNVTSMGMTETRQSQVLTSTGGLDWVRTFLDEAPSTETRFRFDQAPDTPDERLEHDFTVDIQRDTEKVFIDLELWCDVAKALSQDTIDKVKVFEVNPKEETPTEPGVREYTEMTVKERRDTVTVILNNTAKGHVNGYVFDKFSVRPSFTSFAFSTSPFNILEHTYTEAQDLFEHSSALHAHSFNSHISLGVQPDNPWTLTTLVYKDSMTGEPESFFFNFTRWQEGRYENTHTRQLFLVSFAGSVSVIPSSDYDTLHLSLHIAYFPYQNPHSWADVSFTTAILQPQVIGTRFAQYGELNDLVYESVVDRDGTVTRIRIEKHVDLTPFEYGKVQN
jgi:hypothetical protein